MKLGIGKKGRGVSILTYEDVTEAIFYAIIFYYEICKARNGKKKEAIERE